MWQRHSSLHLFVIIFLLSSKYYAQGTLYKLKPRGSIWNEDIIETHNIKSKIHCASMCNQRNGCIGFGISSERCLLFKSIGNEDTCEESCLDLPEIKIYVQTNFKFTTTTTQIPSTTESYKTVTTMSTTSTTSELPTTATDSPETSTTESPATSTQLSTITKIASTPPPKTCECGLYNSFYRGFRANTKFFQGGGMTICQCMGNENLYKGNQDYPTDESVKPGTMTRCIRRKRSGVVEIYNIYDESRIKLEGYQILCDAFYDGIVDKKRNIVVKSSAPENKEVICDPFQVIFGYQAIEQYDGSYEVRLECQPLIPQ